MQALRDTRLDLQRSRRVIRRHAVDHGDAIVRDTERLRDIVCDVNAQELEPSHGTKPGVREERATYLALPARLPSGGASYVVRQHPTYQ